MTSQKRMLLLLIIFNIIIFFMRTDIMRNINKQLEAIVAVRKKISVFWDVTPHSLVLVTDVSEKFASSFLGIYLRIS